MGCSTTKGSPLRLAILVAVTSVGMPAAARAERSTEVGAEQSAATAMGAPRGAGFGLEAIIEYFPTKSTQVDRFGPIEQQAVFTGLRFSFPIWRKLPPGFPTIHGEVSFGYVAAGERAGNGDDGLGASAGGEARWALAKVPWLTPFARLDIARRVTQFTDIDEGTLFTTAVTVAGGAYLVRSVELHLMAGSSYYGDTALGFGVGLGRLF
jgi:hypothetical protein